MRQEIKRLADGILFQFLMVGSLSFSHIHDVVAAHGQAGWKAWLYPLSIDLLTVAAFRKIRAHVGGFGAWVAFLLGLAASLAANIIESWNATATGRAVDVAIGVWPAVALLVCTLLAHDGATPNTATVATPATATPVARPVARPVAVAPAAVASATPAAVTATTTATLARQAAAAASAAATRPATVTARASATKPGPTIHHPKPIAINDVVLHLLATHGTEEGKVTGQMVADAIGKHKATGCRHLGRVREELAAGKLNLPAMSSSLSSSPQTTTVGAP